MLTTVVFGLLPQYGDLTRDGFAPQVEPAKGPIRNFFEAVLGLIVVSRSWRSLELGLSTRLIQTAEENPHNFCEARQLVRARAGDCGAAIRTVYIDEIVEKGMGDHKCL
jgi:hypothetical protein